MNDSTSRPPSTPNPDPTVLTTSALLREISSLRELIGARLDGQDKLFATVQTALSVLPTTVDEKILSLRELHEEKFHSISTQFLERDVRGEQQSKDSKVAVDAALSAAKEAVAKSEVVAIKQIDQQGQLIESKTNALNGKIDDLKERLTRLEGSGVGESTTRTTQHASSVLIVAIVSAIFSSLIGAAAIGISLWKR